MRRAFLIFAAGVAFVAPAAVLADTTSVFRTPNAWQQMAENWLVGESAEVAISTPTPTSTPTATPTPGGDGCDRNATTSTFAAQLAAATGGQTICLASGNYGSRSGIAKAVTFRPAAGASPTISFALRSGSCCFTIDGGLSSPADTSTAGVLTINDDGGPSVGSGVHSVTIRNTRFTSPFRVDGPTNANRSGTLLMEGNRHVGISNAATAAIHLSYGGNPHSGVTVRHSLFSDTAADGIQTGIGVDIVGNEFLRILPIGDLHTDMVQMVGASNALIKGNYFDTCEQAIGSFDGGRDHVVEDNVVVRCTAHWISLLSDTGSVIAHNTIAGSGARTIACYSKSGGVASTPSIRNNSVPGGIDISGPGPFCTPAQNTNNMVTSGAGGGNFSGTPTFVGGASPTTWAGFCLSPLSAGWTGSTTGGPVGVRC